jgi:hypothetical protein
MSMSLDCLGQREEIFWSSNVKAAVVSCELSSKLLRKDDAAPRPGTVLTVAKDGDIFRNAAQISDKGLVT